MNERFYRVLTVTVLLLAFVWAAGAFGQERRELRVDTFDTRSNRTGYAVVNPQTGRVDTFDTRSNRTGSGQVTPPPNPTSKPAPKR